MFCHLYPRLSLTMIYLQNGVLFCLLRRHQVQSFSRHRTGPKIKENLHISEIKIIHNRLSMHLEELHYIIKVNKITSIITTEHMWLKMVCVCKIVGHYICTKLQICLFKKISQISRSIISSHYNVCLQFSVM